jgi:predicted Rossmann fold nucleotide-binding protein DprA/Smf involved in DNA uptake
MNDILTNDTKAIILLCGVLSKDSSAKPLTQVEYNKIVQWLIQKDMRPADLLDYNDLGVISSETKIEQNRLKTLLGRGVQLGFAVEEWQQNGIWIISRGDTKYPKRLKKHLKDKAPPLLFGVGNHELLQGGGLAMVGSRNVDSNGIDFTKRVAEFCAYNRMPVVSGGARGVDQISMDSALNAGGVSIGIVAENLLKKSLSRQFRNAINNGLLLLISPYHPNARFTVGTAMGRNKLIYSMADYGLVVSAEVNKGGTWTGAKEELKREYPIPVFTRQGENVPQGNRKLLELGAVEWPMDVEKENLLQLIAENARTKTHIKDPKVVNMSIFEVMEQIPLEDKMVEEKKYQEPTVDKIVEPETTPQPKPASTVYNVVMPIILQHLEETLSPDELAERMDVVKSQLNKWLKKAVEDGKIKKLSKPVRYKK